MSNRWRIRLFAVLLAAAAWALILMEENIIRGLYDGQPLYPIERTADGPPLPSDPAVNPPRAEIAASDGAPRDVKNAGRMPIYLYADLRIEAWFFLLANLVALGLLIWSVLPRRRPAAMPSGA